MPKRSLKTIHINRQDLRRRPKTKIMKSVKSARTFLYKFMRSVFSLRPCHDLTPTDRSVPTDTASILLSEISWHYLEYCLHLRPPIPLFGQLLRISFALTLMTFFHSFLHLNQPKAMLVYSLQHNLRTIALRSETRLLGVENQRSLL